MKLYIFFDKTANEYFWSDDYEFFLEYVKLNPDYKYIGTTKKFLRDTNNFHRCKHSVLEKDYKPYTDTLQNETKLSDATNYVVNYYKAEIEVHSKTENNSLIKKTDYDISKKEIIDNVNNQKYKEGAWYIPMNKIEDETPDMYLLIPDKNGNPAYWTNDINTEIIQEMEDDLYNSKYKDKIVYELLYESDHMQYHNCLKSAICDNPNDYNDGIQNERYLPDGKYIVLYYSKNNDNDIVNLVDYNLSKEKIIINTINQKYREGAEYFKLNSLVRYEKEIPPKAEETTTSETTEPETSETTQKENIRTEISVSDETITIQIKRNSTEKTGHVIQVSITENGSTQTFTFS